MNNLLEVCAGSLNSALAAQKGGAQRIELCANLSEGGTTPSAGVIRQAVRLMNIPVFVLIRPRSGDFLYSDIEFEAMKEDIVFCKEHRAKGVVFGILEKNGDVDVERCVELVNIARPMQVTFHRAFDMVRFPFKALEEIIGMGFDRILTSGQANSVIEGASLIADLVYRAENRIVIMPGGGITENNAAALIKMTGTREVHASLRSPILSQMRYKENKVSMGNQEQREYEWLETDVERVRAVCVSFKS